MIFVKVIFLQDVKKQGKKGEVKEVSDGYAKNFLIQNGYAVMVTEGSMNKLNYDNAVQKAKEDKEREEACKIKEVLEKKEYPFLVKTGEQDRVFGSVSSKQIADALLKEGYKIDKKRVKLEANLQSLGVHIVKVELYKDVIAQIKVHLKRG